MPKLGEYEYPEFTLTETVALGQRIAREFAGEVSRHGLATALGMSERGGAFSSRLGALRVWGVATGRSRIRVTRDGLRASTPLSPQEAEAARKTLAASVPLFVEVAARSGTAPLDQSRLAILLEDVTGAKRQDILARLSVVDRVFSEVRPLLPEAAMRAEAGAAARTAAAGAPSGAGGQATPTTPVAAGEAGAPERAPAASDAGPSKPPVARPEPRLGRIELVLSDGVLSLPETVTNIDAALTVLWAYRQLVAAREVGEGKAPPSAGAPDFVLRRERPPGEAKT